MYADTINQEKKKEKKRKKPMMTHQPLSTMFPRAPVSVSFVTPIGAVPVVFLSFYSTYWGDSTTYHIRCHSTSTGTGAVSPPPPLQCPSVSHSRLHITIGSLFCPASLMPHCAYGTWTPSRPKNTSWENKNAKKDTCQPSD